jgi:hypothetical protein
MKTWNSGLSQGAGLMLIASLIFIGYAVVFFFRTFAGGGFELGVTTLNGVTPDNRTPSIRPSCTTSSTCI